MGWLSVSLEIGPCHCPAGRRGTATLRRVSSMGDQIRNSPDVSIAHETGSALVHHDINHHRHLGGQFFLRTHVLAHTVL